MIAAQTSAPRKLSDWLSQLGWEVGDRLESRFHLTTPQGEAVLTKIPASSQSAWAEWTLESPLLPVPHPQQIFAANRQIAGPWKFVSTSEGEIFLRGDVPREVFVTDDSFDLATGKTSSPLECWAETTTALAKGMNPTLDSVKPATSQLVDWLKEQGFVASADGDKGKVTVPLSGTFREVSVQWQDRGIVHLAAEIGRVENWPETSRAASEDFLHEANRRLRLVRVARPDEPMVFSMEVCFRAPGPGVWLQAALDALCTGMALVVQPLASLRDPGVADMLLAGTSANCEGGVR